MKLRGSMIGGYDINCVISQPFFNCLHILFAPEGGLTLVLVSNPRVASSVREK